MGKRGFWGICALVALFFLPVEAEARFINIGGSLDFSYGEIKTQQDNGNTEETSFFQQRYNLHNFGELFSPRIGTVLISSTFLKQDTKTDGLSGDQDFHFADYSLAMNLFPYVLPTSLYYQRVNRVNKTDASGAQAAIDIKDRVTTLGGNMSLSAPRLPRLTVSYNQSELESPDDPDRLPNTINRFVNLQSSGQFRETTLIARYQFNEADVARVNTQRADNFRGHAFNLTTESRLGPSLVVSTFSRIANKGGGNGPGSTFSQERGFGGSLFFAPTEKWDSHARVNYSETPASLDGETDLKQKNVFLSSSYRPTEELDMVVSGRYFLFDVSGVETISPFADYSVNYRPFFGFSSGLGASYGQTETKGGESDLTTDYTRYRGNIDYTRALELIRYSSGYGLSYGLSETEGQDPSESNDIMHTISLGLENTQIQYVHISLGYTFNDLNRSHTGADVQEVGDQISHLYQMNANSSYFRALLFEEDSLFLQGTASMTKIDGFGADGETRVGDLQANYYFFRGAVLSSGLTRTLYPDGFYPTTNAYYEELRWSFYIGSTSFSLGARANQDRTDGDRSFDRDGIETDGNISYQIGKFTLSADGRWSKDTSKTRSEAFDEDIDYESQSFFLRASRSF